MSGDELAVMVRWHAELKKACGSSGQIGLGFNPCSASSV